MWFVSLVGLKSEKYLAETIAEALNLELGTDTAVSQLTNYLRQKELLLILDNFEHILDGADLLVTVLKAAPELKIMVTSKVVLMMVVRLAQKLELGLLDACISNSQR